jgi:adenosylcobinamide-phosphate guanylyltransferase
LKVPALVMAGGRGSRMGLPTEKPMLLFLGEPFISRVVAAVLASKSVSSLTVVTSPNTPLTEALCRQKGLDVFRAGGNGYHLDLKEVIAKKNLKCPLLTVSADLPTLTGEFLDKAVAAFLKCGKDALAVYVTIAARERLGLSTSSLDRFEGQSVCISGVNIIDGAKINQPTIPSGALIEDDNAVLFNVNTAKDLEIAQALVAGKKL